jgi:hypothetical protein
MRAFSYFDKIVNDQNNGIPCPLCGFSQGHKVTCRTLNGSADNGVIYRALKDVDFNAPQPNPLVKPYTEFDKQLLYVLGIDLREDKR